MSDIKVAELRNLKPPPETGAVRFYKRGGTYYVIDDDAAIIAHKYLRSIGSLKETSDGRYVGMSEILYTSVLRDLLLYNRTSIELFEFETGKWSFSVQASPGNITQVIDLISNELDLTHSSILLAVSGTESNDQLAFNAACCDPTLFNIATTEFIDNSSLCYFEALLTQTMPSEILIAGGPEETMIKIIEKFEIPYRKTGVKASITTGKFPATKSVKALLSAVQVNLNEFSHQQFKLQEFMTIDFSAWSALNIFPEGKTGKGLETSLYELLDECVTPMGSRLLHQYMQQPLIDKDAIDRRLRYVDFCIREQTTTMALRNRMRQLPDIARLTKKLLRGKANLQDCVRFHDIGLVAPILVSLQDSELADLADVDISQAQAVVELVRTCIDFSMIPQHIYRINPAHHSTLTQSADEMDKIKAQMENLRQQVASDIGIEPEKLKLERGTNQQTFYFKISRKLEKNIRSNDEYVVIETRKDGARFTTRKLRKLGDRFFELEAEYGEQQKQISSQLISDLKEYVPMFQTLNDVFAQLDVFLAFASAAEKCSFVKPSINLNTNLKLTEARHPLVEKHTAHFIPNDVEMERGKSSFMIISGPNSAGKSTLLKTVGICVYLAHIGSFVPCESAIIPITTSIHARIGAWDSVQMSTFTVEMTEMANILRSAKATSLVLVDELGRSTSCSDGFGLAWALSKHLAQKIGAFCLFATHFHELCNLESKIPCVANFHMDVRAEANLLMLYKLKPGPFPKSFGLDAAERAGFPPSVIKRAMEKTVELEIADQEEGDKPSHIRINPNEPYQHAFERIRSIDIDTTTPAQLVAAVQDAIDSLDEKLNQSETLLSKR